VSQSYFQRISESFREAKSPCVSDEKDLNQKGTDSYPFAEFFKNPPFEMIIRPQSFFDCIIYCIIYFITLTEEQI